MTIKSVEASDWEGFRNLVLNFSDYVTVLYGLSHKGKSSIVRIFDYLINNEPSGTSYFPRGEDNPKTDVGCELDNGFVRRVRDKKNNFYETDAGKFKALRSGVPQQVIDTFNMAPINLQIQKDIHHILMMTAGQRAKMLNNLAGLDEMDRAQVTIKSMCKSVEGTFNLKTEQLKDEKLKVEEYDWVEDARSRFNEVKAEDANIEKAWDDIEEIQRVLKNVEHIEEEMDLLPDTDAIPLLKEIISAHANTKSAYQKVDILENAINACSLIENELANINLPEQQRLNEIDAITVVIKAIDRDINSLSRTIENIQRIESRIDKVDEELESAQSAVEEFRKSFDVCPFCTQKIT